jgi:hypothetical protein
MGVDDIFELSCTLSQLLPLFDPCLKLLLDGHSFMRMLKVLDDAFRAKEFLVLVRTVLVAAYVDRNRASPARTRLVEVCGPVC